MKFLADQDVYASTVRFLSGLAHAVVTAGQLGLAKAEDTELLRVAHEQSRIFVTRDRDFGGLVFVQGSGPGVIYPHLTVNPGFRACRVGTELDPLHGAGTASFVRRRGAGTPSNSKAGRAARTITSKKRGLNVGGEEMEL